MERRRVFTVIFAAAAGLLLLGSTCKLANKAPAVPTLTGPNTGVAGVAVSFTATATDPESDSIQFQFDWGDGTTPAWTAFVASGDTVTATNTYADSGTFTVKARAKDSNGKESDWSVGHTLSLIAAGPAYPDSVVGEIVLPWGILSSCMSQDGTLLGLGGASEVDSLAIIRNSDRAVLARIGVGSLVSAIAISPDNRFVYATGVDSGTAVVRKIDIAESRVVATVPVRNLAYAIEVTPDDGRVLLGQETNVLVLSGDDLSVLDSVALPHSAEWLTLNRTGTALYVTTYLGVGLVDVQGCSLRAFRETDDAWSQALSADEQVLYVSSQPDSGLLALGAGDLSIVQHLNLHYRYGPKFVAASPDGRYLYLGSGALHVIDLHTSNEIDSLAPPGAWSCDGLLLQPSGDSLYYVYNRTVYVIGKRQ